MHTHTHTHRKEGIAIGTYSKRNLIEIWHPLALRIFHGLRATRGAVSIFSANGARPGGRRVVDARRLCGQEPGRPGRAPPEKKGGTSGLSSKSA